MGLEQDAEAEMRRRQVEASVEPVPAQEAPQGGTIEQTRENNANRGGRAFALEDIVNFFRGEANERTGNGIWEDIGKKRPALQSTIKAGMIIGGAYFFSNSVSNIASSIFGEGTFGSYVAGYGANLMSAFAGWRLANRYLPSNAKWGTFLNFFTKWWTLSGAISGIIETNINLLKDSSISSLINSMPFSDYLESGRKYTLSFLKSLHNNKVARLAAGLSTYLGIEVLQKTKSGISKTWNFANEYKGALGIPILVAAGYAGLYTGLKYMGLEPNTAIQLAIGGTAATAYIASDHLTQNRAIRYITKGLSALAGAALIYQTGLPDTVMNAVSSEYTRKFINDLHWAKTPMSESVRNIGTYVLSLVTPILALEGIPRLIRYNLSANRATAQNPAPNQA